MNSANDDMGLGILLCKGITGTVTPFLGLAISVQSTLAALQIVSLSVGIAVGLATLHSILKKRNK